MSLITLQAVNKQYFGHPVLEQISFQLDRGERLCLIGNNGAGKTTLLRLILGLEKPDSGDITLAGAVICGYLPQSLPDDSQAGDESWISPEIRRLEAALRETEQQMAEFGERGSDDPALRLALARYADLTARYEAAGGYEHRHLMEEALGGLGLTGQILERPLSTLSGGERMRVALARLIIRNPDLLLLDEPTNHLDLSALEWLEQYLTRFRGSVLLISHDRMFIDRTATAVGELNGGRITIRPGGYTRFFEQAAAEALTLDREIKKVSRELEHQQDVAQTMLSHRKMTAYHAREKAAARLASRLGEIADRSRYQQQNLNFRFLPGLTTGDPDRILLQAESITGGYDGTALFSDVSFVLRGRSRTCLCGPNGCGKSTVLNLLRGRHAAMDGQVRLAAQMVCGYLGQQVDFPDESQTVLGELLSRCDLSEGQARDLLARYGFRDTHVFKQLSMLSGGERSRLYLACLLLEQPNILFLDEPTNHLDVYSREILEQALTAFAGAILAVSHDRMFIARCCDRVLGFIGTAVKPFESFEAYRTAARATELQATGPKESDKSAKARPDLNARQNRAVERRETALQKERLRTLERKIETCEQEKTTLEKSFGTDTEPEQYRRYAVLLDNLDDLYGEYLTLATVLADSSTDQASGSVTSDQDFESKLSGPEF